MCTILSLSTYPAYVFACNLLFLSATNAIPSTIIISLISNKRRSYMTSILSRVGRNQRNGCIN